MDWELSPGEDGVPVWQRQVGEIRLLVHRSSERYGQWKWELRYRIVYVVGYSRTVRGAKMRATKAANDYVKQSVMTGE